MFSRWFVTSALLALFLLMFAGSASFLRLKARFFAAQSYDEEVVALTSKIAALETKLDMLSGIAKRLPTHEVRSMPAMTYSTYPFNAKQTLTISVGTAQGILPRMPVLSADQIFVGRVVQVFQDAAVVETIFDPGFEMPVRIGKEGVDAIMRGGAAPFLDLIPKGAHVNEGDSVFTSGTVAPFGVPLGTVGSVRNQDYEAFQSAAVQLPYTLNDLREVLVVTSYVPNH